MTHVFIFLSVQQSKVKSVQAFSALHCLWQESPHPQEHRAFEVVLGGVLAAVLEHLIERFIQPCRIFHWTPKELYLLDEVQDRMVLGLVHFMNLHEMYVRHI